MKTIYPKQVKQNQNAKLLFYAFIIAICLIKSFSGFAQSTIDLELDTLDLSTPNPLIGSQLAPPEINVAGASTVNAAPAGSIVAIHGALRAAKYGTLYGASSGRQVTLRGVSLFWSNQPKANNFYDENTIYQLVNDWKVTVVRAAIGVNTPYGYNSGYHDDPATAYAQVDRIVKACVKYGIYVIIDFHVGNEGNYYGDAIKFFQYVSLKYKNVPNVMYEDWNEPQYPKGGYMTDQDKLDYWDKVIKPYHEGVVKVIRKNTNNLVICGTGEFSQDVDFAANRKINQTNVAYTLHFYARTHRAALRRKVLSAYKKGIAIFVTEFGTTSADGGQHKYVDGIDVEFDSDVVESTYWLAFLEKYGISHCQWAIGAADEGSAALRGDPGNSNNWLRDGYLSKSGRFARTTCRQYAGFPDYFPPTDQYYQFISYDMFKPNGYSNQKAMNIFQANSNPGGWVISFPTKRTSNFSVFAPSNEKFTINPVNSQFETISSALGLAIGNFTTNTYTRTFGYNANDPHQQYRLMPVSVGYMTNLYKIVSANGECITQIDDFVALNKTIYYESKPCNLLNGKQRFLLNPLYSISSGIGARQSADSTFFDNNLDITHQSSEAVPTVVFPNPSNSTFTINEIGEYNYGITNISGIEVEKGKGTDMTEVGRNLPAGTYLIKIETINENKPERKVIKVVKE